MAVVSRCTGGKEKCAPFKQEVETKKEAQMII
jgi:hypothetical protein